MLWIKTLHIFFMITWMAGMLYLPRLFVYHAQASDQVSLDRFKVMERKLFFGIMTPGAVLTLLFGLWLMVGYGFAGTWLTIKLVAVVFLIGHHIWCYRALVAFRQERNHHGHVYYRWMNEVPVLYLAVILVMVVVKPL